MDKQEFCDSLKKARQLSGIAWVDLCYKLHKTQSALLQMLDYKNDYGMKKIFEFLNALGWSVSLSMNNKQEYELDSLNSLTNFIHAEYEGIPGRQIAIRFNLSDETGRRMLKGGDVRLSTFLKMAEDKGFSIHIQPKDIGAIIDATDDCDAEQ